QRQKALESTLQNAVFNDQRQKNRVHMEHYEAAVHPGTSELAQICRPPSCPMVREAGNNVDQWLGLSHVGVKLAGSDKYDGHLAAEPELFYASLSDYGIHPSGQSSLMDDLHPHKDRPLSYIQNWGIPAIFCGSIFILILLRAVSQGSLSDHLSNSEQQNSINQKEASTYKVNISHILTLLIFSSTLLIAQSNACDTVTEDSFTFDDGSTTCVSTLECNETGEIWVDVGTGTPSCFNNTCTNNQYIDVDEYQQPFCVDSCPWTKIPTILSTSIKKCRDICPVSFAFDDGRTKCLNNTCTGDKQIWLDDGTDTPLCYTNNCGNKSIDVAENHTTITCVEQCPELKTNTTLPTGVLKCVNACPAGQSRFRYPNGTFKCQPRCSGSEKAIELLNSTVVCVTNDCQLRIDPEHDEVTPPPVLTLDSDSPLGYNLYKYNQLSFDSNPCRN
ncbi:MAG: hypothetical protein EZS28_042888, partial [Streblomastix strix]